MNKPTWWPETPYPESIFPMTVDEYITAVPDEKLRTAISGHLARFGWDVAVNMIWRALTEDLGEGVFDLDTEHGCFTGDCSHTDKSVCIEALMAYVQELCQAGRKLELLVKEHHGKEAGKD